MTERPNHPVIFGVDHEGLDVDTSINFFRKAVKGRTHLYIELSPQKLTNLPTFPESLSLTDARKQGQAQAYQRLAFEAQKAGLKVIPLDSQTHEEFVEGLKKNKSRREYQSMTKREKMWAQKLDGLTKRAIIVMQPVHAKEMIKILQIPKHNIAYLTHNERDKHYEAFFRPIAERERKRIEHLRQLRKLKKVAQRIKRRVMK